MANDNTSLSVLNFKNQSVKIITDENGVNWFKASDVCDALNIKKSRQAVDLHVFEEDACILGVLTKTGKKNAKFVNESGLYALIFGSKKPEAKAFKKWVTSEVLPAIRKTGTYSVPTTQDGETIVKAHVRKIPAKVKRNEDEITVKEALALLDNAHHWKQKDFDKNIKIAHNVIYDLADRNQFIISRMQASIEAFVKTCSTKTPIDLKEVRKMIS